MQQQSDASHASGQRAQPTSRISITHVKFYEGRCIVKSREQVGMRSFLLENVLNAKGKQSVPVQAIV
eukprot:750044-Hanusia_phi.AAC.1